MLALRLLFTAENLSDAELHMVTKIMHSADYFGDCFKEFNWKDDVDLVAQYTAKLKWAKDPISLITLHGGSIALLKTHMNYLEK